MQRLIAPTHCLASSLFLIFGLWVSPLLAATNVEVELQVPSPLTQGQVYEARLEVRSSAEIRDAYVKLSLPYALHVLEGRTHFRGTVAAGESSVIRVRFKVTGFPTAPIIGKVVAYDQSGRAVSGKGRFLYCKAAGDQVVLSEGSPESQDDEGSIVKALLIGPARYEPSLGPLAPEALAENSVIEAKLQTAQKIYRFDGHRGDRIWVTAESTDFDPRLFLLRSDGTMVAENDDAIGATAARIPAQGVFELSADDTYIVVITSHEEEASGAFRLTVENLTHPGPPSGTVLPAVQTEPLVKSDTPTPTADVTLSGRILYNAPDGPAPVRFALVWLFVEGFLSDRAISNGQTDANGNVSLRVPQSDVTDTLLFRVYTQDAGERIVVLKDPDSGFVRSAKSFSFRLSNSPAATFGTWNLAGTGQNESFVVFDAAVEGYLISTQVLGLTPPPVLVWYPAGDRFFGLIPNPLDTDAHYEQGAITLSRFYGSSPDVVLHEYGHFLADRGGFAGVGGRHYIPFHQRVNASLAWGEGWASFFAVAGQHARSKPWKRRMVSNHPSTPYDYDLENGHDPAYINGAVAGDDNEGSVQFILWDLYDSLQDALPIARTTDSVSFGLKTIFDVARSGAALYTPTGSAAVFRTNYLEEFYVGLMQQLLPGPSQAGAIQAVVADQRISWQVPPSPPNGLRFAGTGGATQLQWQAGSANTAGYLVQQRLPGQGAFTTVATVTGNAYALSNVAIGTSFRLYALSVNQARFSAPFLSSSPSQEMAYSGSVQPPVITLSGSRLDSSFAPGGPLPPAQSVSVTNGGGGSLSWSASSSATWLLVSPPSGTAPSSISVSVNPTGLRPGTFNGTVTVSSPAIASQSVTVNLLVLTQTLTQAPIVSSVVNAASFRPGMVVGGLATLFGKNLSPVDGIELPGAVASYKGVTVSVQGRAVPLLGVANVNGQEQINFQVPFDFGVPSTARVEVNNSGSIGALDNVPVVAAQPGIFEYVPQGSSVRYGAVVKTDGSVVGPGNRLSAGDAASIFLTGMGVTLPLLQTGQFGPSSPPAVTYLQTAVAIGGVSAQVLFSGYAPGFLGLYQINVVVPNSAPTDAAVNLDVVVGGVASQSSHIAVQ